MFAFFVGFGVVGTQKAHYGEACRRGSIECQAREAKKESYLVTSMSYWTTLFKSYCCIKVASIKCYCILRQTNLIL